MFNKSTFDKIVIAAKELNMHPMELIETAINDFLKKHSNKQTKPKRQLPDTARINEVTKEREHYKNTIKKRLEQLGIDCNKDYVYTLSLENGKFYVGWSNDLLHRMVIHFMVGGSGWTKKHKPLNIIDVRKGEKASEDLRTLEMMHLHGIDNVRGGNWCSIKDFNEADKLKIRNRIDDVFNNNTIL